MKIKVISILFFICFSSVYISCKESFEKNSQNFSKKKAVPVILDDTINNRLQEKKEFIRKKLIGREHYKFIFSDDYILTINSNENTQEIEIIKKDLAINQVIEDYYETPDIWVQLYTSSENEEIVIVEGHDYYGSIFGVYMIKDLTLKKLDFLNFAQDKPEENGVKKLHAQIFRDDAYIYVDYFLGTEQLFSKKYDCKLLEVKKKNQKLTKFDVNDSLHSAKNQNYTKKEKQLFNTVWSGVYDFHLSDIEKMGELHSISYKLLIKEHQKIQIRIDGGKIKNFDCQIKKITKDSLVLRKGKSTTDLILVKKKNQYFISGQDIYMLNPPNDNYLIEKNNL
ncbi:hypothetical protein GCM10022393_01910 [Aquimarina addita]|uniref:Lipoprotein n=1 Tax=Aquimarina addita TaxID=870485 RepID=A0ABP7X834_9FLAO